MTTLQTLCITAIALLVIGLTGAGWLAHDCTFDQFLGIAGPSGGLAVVLHAFLPEKQPVQSAAPPPAAG